MEEMRVKDKIERNVLMESNIKIKTNKADYTEKSGITLLQLIQKHQIYNTSPILAAKVNNELKKLTEILTQNCEVEFIDRSHEDGLRIYVRTLTMLFIRACKELFPNCRVTVEHSLNKGLYCEIKDETALSPRQVNRIESRMREIAAACEPFERFEADVNDAQNILKSMGFADKAELLKYRAEKTIPLYRFGWMTDCLYGYMVPDAGYLDVFELKFYLPGLILRFPTKQTPNSLPDFEDNPKLYSVFRESENWAQRVNVANVLQLNNKIEIGGGQELIHISEALHEKQIAEIADKISSRRQQIHLILIAGPSASGKTTFAQRLKIHLMVNGLNPIPISMDNYYLDRESIPLDEEGQRDLEAISTIDIELLNEHLSRLIQGQQVEIPFFNFKKGEREYRGNLVSISDQQPLIIEGIHGLNEQLTPMIPKINKFKIYISALTQLNLDSHNRIPTTDTRLIRRIVRDRQFRGASIGDTLTMWSSVRRGEEKYIFPFQEMADVMFNSALTYEMAVLKPYIMPLLNNIDTNDIHFTEANRLKKFMKYFVEMDGTSIPATSIIKEFTGGSCFNYGH